MINSQNVTLNDMVQFLQFGVAIDTEVALPKKDMAQQTVTGWVCNKERANCSFLPTLLITYLKVSGGKDTDIWTISQYNPPKKQNV